MKALFGDLPGHEFRGNQYTGAGANYESHSAATANSRANYHTKQYKMHQAAASAALAKGNEDQANRHMAAAVEHNRAREAYRVAATVSGWTSKGESPSPIWEKARTAAAWAADRSSRVNKKAGDTRKFGRNVVKQSKKIGTRC